MGSSPRGPLAAGIVFALAVGLAGTGCGERDGPDAGDAMQEALAAADAVNPCALLTESEIRELLSAVPAEPEPGYFENATTCAWSRADDIAVPLVVIAISDVAAESYEAYLENSEELLGYRATPETAQQVEGPGRFAVWLPAGDRGAFQFFIDGHMVQVVAGPVGERTALEICRALAVIIDQRLP